MALAQGYDGATWACSTLKCKENCNIMKKIHFNRQSVMILAVVHVFLMLFLALVMATCCQLL